MHPNCHKTGGARTRWRRRQAPTLVHKESRQSLPMHHLYWLEDDAPRWSLSLVATMLRATRPCHGPKPLVPAEMGSRGHLEPWDPLPGSRSPWLHCVRMCPTGKGSGINTLWLPPMFNQSLQWGTGESQQNCPLQPTSCPTSDDDRDHGTVSVHAKTREPSPDSKPHTASPKISPRATVLSPLQANICIGAGPSLLQ